MNAASRPRVTFADNESDAENAGATPGCLPSSVIQALQIFSAFVLAGPASASLLPFGSPVWAEASAGLQQAMSQDCSLAAGMPDNSLAWSWLSAQPARQAFPSAEDPSLCAAAYAAVTMRGQAALMLLLALLLVATKVPPHFLHRWQLQLFWVVAGMAGATASWCQAGAGAWFPSSQGLLVAAVQAAVALTHVLLLLSDGCKFTLGEPVRPLRCFEGRCCQFAAACFANLGQLCGAALPRGAAGLGAAAAARQSWSSHGREHPPSSSAASSSLPPAAARARSGAASSSSSSGGQGGPSVAGIFDGVFTESQAEQQLNDQLQGMIEQQEAFVRRCRADEQSSSRRSGRPKQKFGSPFL